jgi:transposase
MRIAARVVLTDEQSAQLEAYARGRRIAARLVLRAKIVLLAAEGKQDLEIAAALGVVARTAARWRARFLKLGVAGLEKDAPRPGHATVLTAERRREIVAMTTQQKPANATHWSTRSMAAAAGVSEASVRRVWKAHGLKPHRLESFKLSNDPRFVEKLEDIVALYLNPPEHALVLSLDEKSQIQALDRTQPGLPMKKGRAQTMTHDYKRHGTTTLFAALNILDGSVIGRCMQRHRHQEFIRFLNQVEAEVPVGKIVHAIVDNYATHKHPKVRAWLVRHPRWTFHFTPTSASWLNAVEGFFSVLTRRRLKRGVFRSIVDLQAAINRYVVEHNDDPKPFKWTADPRRVLAAISRGNQALESIH